VLTIAKKYDSIRPLMDSFSHHATVRSIYVFISRGGINIDNIREKEEVSKWLFWVLLAGLANHFRCC
jgi:hypothetical protein